MRETLEPCPFCGGEAKYGDGGNTTYGRFFWVVWCEECQFEMRDRVQWDDDYKLVLPAKECFDRWNRRSLTPIGFVSDDCARQVEEWGVATICRSKTDLWPVAVFAPIQPTGV
jgi:hypothetical protein